MNINKQVVIGRLCEITTTVGNHFKNEFATDCFCGSNELIGGKFSGYQFDDIIIDFIAAAVLEKIEREKI